MTSIDFRAESPLPADIREAATVVWDSAGKRLPRTRIHIDKARPMLEAAATTVPDAVAQLVEFLNIPVPTSI